jgi:hypothetical protein
MRNDQVIRLVISIIIIVLLGIILWQAFDPWRDVYTRQDLPFFSRSRRAHRD